jgi:putative phage-type endonuclease
METSNDSEFVASTESDDSSVGSLAISVRSRRSRASTLALSLIEDIDEDDICEITIDILEQIDEYMNNEIVMLSNPTFYEDMMETIATTVFNDWRCYLICEEDDDIYQEIHDFVEQVHEIYEDISNIPKRSIAYSNYIVKTPLSNDIERTLNKINALKNVPQPAQKTPEWFEFRNSLISASNLWKALGSEANKNSLIYEKCQPVRNDYIKGNTGSAAHWGNKYEPVTVMIYEDMFKTTVGEFGCIRHPKYKFIGASPDGINIDPTTEAFGRMLEIKNIVNRDITGIPKEEYWVQTQVQMETCDLEECDFMETRILEYPSEDAFYEDTEKDYRGVVLHFIETDVTSATVNLPRYKYMPLNIPLEKEAIEDWIQQTRLSARSDGLVLFTTLYWYLEEFSCVVIPRNRKWFAAALPHIEDVWNIIVKERIDGYEHRATKKRTIKTLVTSSDNANSYVIENMNMSNSICLIRLDEDGNPI